MGGWSAPGFPQKHSQHAEIGEIKSAQKISPVSQLNSGSSKNEALIVGQPILSVIRGDRAIERNRRACSLEERNEHY